MLRVRAALFGISVCATGLACVGEIGRPRTESPSRGPEAAPVTSGRETASRPCAPAVERRVRLLSRAEYERVVSDLLGRPFMAAGLPPDPRVEGFDNNADALTVSADHAQEYARMAEQIAAALPLTAGASCDAEQAPRACAERFAHAFARRAWGRPLDSVELARLLDVYEVGRAEEGHEAGLRLVATAVLAAPSFLYRTELGGADMAAAGSVTALGPWEVANQLAFALTGRRPDPELLAAAESGRLGSRDVLAAEAARLYAKPEARAHFRRFVLSWLGLLDLGATAKVWIVYPEFTPALRADMEEEVARVIDDALGAGDTLQALLGGRGSFVNPRLRDVVYGAEVLDEPGDFSRVRLDPERRRGVLTLSGFLTAHAAVDRTSPVDRGLFVRVRLLCGEIPSPPPTLDVKPIDVLDGSRTTRQKLEAHSADPRCRSCHSLIDPIGFGFERLDGIGRHRTSEQGHPVDARGALTGTDVDGAITGATELVDRLLQSRQVRDCFVAQVYRFLEGRAEGGGEGDRCALANLRASFAEPGRGLRDLVLEYVRSPGFAARRSER